MLFNSWSHQNRDFFTQKIIGAVDSSNKTFLQTSFDIWMKHCLISGHSQFVHCIEVNANDIIFPKTKTNPFKPISFVFVSSVPLAQLEKTNLLNWLLQYVFYNNQIQQVNNAFEFIIFKYNWTNQQEQEQVEKCVLKKFYTAQLAKVRFCDITTLQQWYERELSKAKPLLMKHFQTVLPCVLGNNDWEITYASKPQLQAKLLLLPDLFAKDNLTLAAALQFLKANKLITINRTGDDYVPAGSVKPVAGCDQYVNFRCAQKHVMVQTIQSIVLGEANAYKVDNARQLLRQAYVVNQQTHWTQWFHNQLITDSTDVFWFANITGYLETEWYRLLFLCGMHARYPIRHLKVYLPKPAEEYFPPSVWTELQQLVSTIAVDHFEVLVQPFKGTQ